MSIGQISNVRVLVAEDDSEMRAVITDELTDEGYVVTQVEG
jgi:CheY-like chemotaxis protein